MNRQIIYLTNAEIDKRKWDDTLSTSPQGRVYAFSWYLDCMSPQWDALILDDYKAIFPLPYTENIPGVKRIFQPRVCQQLGLFMKNGDVTESLMADFLKNIPAHFKSVDLQLHDQTPKPALEGWTISNRTNMILSVSSSYKEIEQAYSEHHRRNIRKSKGTDLKAIDHLTPEKFVNCFIAALNGKIRHYSEAQKNGLISLIKISLNKDAGFIRALGDSTGQLLSACFFLQSHGRIYYALPFSTQKGRETGAMYKLLDAIFWEYSGKHIVFDFEGSSIEGVARFNKGFGATSVTFYRIYRENLPWWVKWLLRVRSFFKK